MACTIVQAVVKASRQSNGKGQISIPWGSVTLQTDFDETWNMQLCHGYDHTCKSMWRCNNVGGLGAHVTCDLFGFLVYL